MSDYERRRFHRIARRIHDAGFASGEGYEEGIYEAEDDNRVQDTEEDVIMEEEGEKEAERGEEDDARLLERFMHGLSQEQRHLVFNLLDEGMREVTDVQNGGTVDTETGNNPGSAERIKAETDGSTHGIRNGAADIEQRRIEEAAKKEKETAETVLSEKGVTDELEQLVNDMEVLDLSYEQIIARLPQELVQEFEKRLRDERASRLVVLWQPWWFVSGKSDREQGGVVIEDGEVEEGQMPPLPVAADLCVPLEVPRRNASTSVTYNVVEVVVAYCHALRMCNGEWRVQVVDVARRMWETSAVLAHDRRYGTVEGVCEACLEGIVRKDQSNDAAVEALNDAAAVLSGLSEWVARALFESQRIFDEAISQVDAGNARKHVKARARKVAYFVSWALCQDSESFVRAAREILSFVGKIAEQQDEVCIAENAVRLLRERQGRRFVSVIE